jgi:hypothetical protein
MPSNVFFKPSPDISERKLTDTTSTTGIWVHLMHFYKESTIVTNVVLYRPYAYLCRPKFVGVVKPKTLQLAVSVVTLAKARNIFEMLVAKHL